MRDRRWRHAVAGLACGLLVAVPAGAMAVDPAVEFPNPTPDAGPEGIVAGPDGNLWFSQLFEPRIGRITPTGTITEFGSGITGVNGRGIAAGPDGNLWFTEESSDIIGRINPTTGMITEFTAGITNGAAPYEIAAGADGNLWFTEAGGDRIGRITPAGVVTEFSTGIEADSSPRGITAGPDGNVWFTQSDSDEIARITPTGVITEYALPANATPYYITTGPDGNLWITELNRDRIMRFDPPSGANAVEFPLTVGSKPGDIVTGPDGNLWFIEFGSTRIGRITPAGVVTEFSNVLTPAFQELLGIEAGPDGNLWFTERNGNAIGRFGTDVPAPTTGNLLRNPGFEMGTATTSGTAKVPVPGWATTPNLTSLAYGSVGPFPTTAVGDAIGGGDALASGGPNNALSQAIQRVDVGAHAAAIDDDRATANLSAHLGGQGTEEDAATVTATFLSATETTLGTRVIGPVTRADRGDQTTLLPRSASVAVPGGTRAIRVNGTATRATPTYNSGYFDNVSLTLDIAPAPGDPPGGDPPPGDNPPPVGNPLPGGNPSPPGRDGTAPGLDGLRAVPSTFAVAAGQTAQNRRRRTIPRGTSLRFRLTEAATVTLSFARRAAGRRVGNRCVKPTRGNRRRRRCARYVTAGTLTRPSTAGANRVPFTGRIGRRTLRLGRHRLTARARDAAGNTSVRRTTAFRIARRR